MASILTMAVFAMVANVRKNIAFAKINCFFQPQYNPMIDFTSTIQYVQCHIYFEELLHGSMLLNFLSKAHDRGRPCDA